MELLAVTRTSTVRKDRAENAADELGERDAEQHPGPGAGHAGEEVAQAHAGIDHHRHGAELEKRKGRGDERQALPHHDERAIAGAHARGPTAARPTRRPRRASSAKVSVR